jgi:glucose-1-phosphatase
MRSPALIFDFGNVIAFFDYTRSCDRLVSELGLPTTGAQLIASARGRGLPALVSPYERGEIDDDVFIRSLTSLLELDASPEQVRRAWADIFWLNEPVAQLVSRLDELGYRLILGSNTNAIHASGFLQQFASTFLHFDALVLSYEVGHSKPSGEFFEACVLAAQRPANECLFIDDLAENIAGAKAAGLATIHFVDCDQLISQLREHGIEI